MRAARDSDMPMPADTSGHVTGRLATTHRAHAQAGVWIVGHLLPLGLLPIVTHVVGASWGIDRAAAVMHATTVLLVTSVQATVLRRIYGTHTWWAGRAVLAYAAAFAVAMVMMSSIDLAGFDTAATPVAMLAAGTVHGLILGWPLAGQGATRQWVFTSALSWLLGTGVYRILLAYGLTWHIGARSAFGYAYTGGHNELLWQSTGYAIYGLVTGIVITRSRSFSEADA